MSRTVFREDLCKGCGICISVCPQHILSSVSERINHKGYHPVESIDNDKCTGCAICARSCPDMVIEVYRS